MNRFSENPISLLNINYKSSMQKRYNSSYNHIPRVIPPPTLGKVVPPPIVVPPPTLDKVVSSTPILDKAESISNSINHDLKTNNKTSCPTEISIIDNNIITSLNLLKLQATFKDLTAVSNYIKLFKAYSNNEYIDISDTVSEIVSLGYYPYSHRLNFFNNTINDSFRVLVKRLYYNDRMNLLMPKLDLHTTDIPLENYNPYESTMIGTPQSIQCYSMDKPIIITVITELTHVHTKVKLIAPGPSYKIMLNGDIVSIETSEPFIIHSESILNEYRYFDKNPRTTIEESNNNIDEPISNIIFMFLRNIYEKKIINNIYYTAKLRFVHLSGHKIIPSYNIVCQIGNIINKSADEIYELDWLEKESINDI